MRNIVLAIILLLGGSIASAADVDAKKVLHRPVPDWSRTPPLAPLEWDSKKFGPVILVEQKAQMKFKTGPVSEAGTGYCGVKIDSKKKYAEASLDAAPTGLAMSLESKQSLGKVPILKESAILEQFSKLLKAHLKNLAENKEQDVVIEIHLTRVDSSQSNEDGKVVVISNPAASGSQSSDQQH